MRDDVSAEILLKSVMLKRKQCRTAGVSMGVFWRAPASNFSAGIKRGKATHTETQGFFKKIEEFVQLVAKELEDVRLREVCWH